MPNCVAIPRNVAVSPFHRLTVSPSHRLTVSPFHRFPSHRRHECQIELRKIIIYMLTISYTYRMLQRHDRSLRAKTERLFLLGIEQCRICQNRETINLWRRYCLELNESITILSGDDVLALPHETYARSIERGKCNRTIQYQRMEKRPQCRAAYRTSAL